MFEFRSGTVFRTWLPAACSKFAWKDFHCLTCLSSCVLFLALARSERKIENKHGSPYDRYFGWGNVRIDGSDRPACQHGPLECKINRVLNCGQHYSTNQDVFFSFLFCVESSVELGQDVEASVPGCAKTAGIVLSDIEDCTKGDLGDKLEQEAHKATDALKPAHLYVPWVVVNGIPIGEQADYVGSYVCAAYNGTRPDACYQLPGRGQTHQPVMLSH